MTPPWPSRSARACPRASSETPSPRAGLFGCIFSSCSYTRRCSGMLWLVSAIRISFMGHERYASSADSRKAHTIKSGYFVQG